MRQTRNRKAHITPEDLDELKEQVNADFSNDRNDELFMGTVDKRDKLILEGKGRKKRRMLKKKRGPKLNLQELEELGNPLDSIERR